MARILIIDDEAGIRQYLVSVLTQIGYEALEAEDGRTGLERAADRTVALIIADLVLPGALQGVPLIRKLREARPDCPIVVISGHPSEETVAACRDLNVTDFLSKPFEMSFLADVLARCLSARAVSAREPAP